MSKILIVDDDASMRDALILLLSRNGHVPICAADGHEALNLFVKDQPDLVLLDIMLPGRDGFEVCEDLRRLNGTVPIVFLSAKGDIVDKRTGFRAGGDDHITKPFDSAELLLRIESLLRRHVEEHSVEMQTEKMVFDDLEIDVARRIVICNGQLIKLSSKEFQLLAYLATQKGRVLSNAQILRGVWGDDFAAEPGVVAVYVRRLREKVEKTPSKPDHILTEWGVGYRFV